MNDQERKIAKNTSYFTLALIAQKVLSFFYFSYIAVKVGATGLGQYSFALFFTTIFAVLIDLGLSNVIVREVSKISTENKEEVQKYFSSALFIKIPLAILVYLLAVTIINFLNNPPLVKQLVYLSGIIMAIDSFSLTFFAFLRARQNLFFESIATVFTQVIIFICGFFVVNYLGGDLRLLILAILLASVFSLIVASVAIKKRLGLIFKIALDKIILKKLWLIIVPFALAGIFTRVYGYLDTILLNQLVGPTALGFYSLPYKLTFSLQFIPLAFIASLYPAFADYFVRSKDLLKQTFNKSLLYLGIIAVPMTFGALVLGRSLILLFYSEKFSASVLPLVILMIGLPFLFLNFPLGSLLNACDRQRRNTWHLAIVMIVNVILNFVLIPRYSYNGAAVASTVSTILMFVLQMSVAGVIVEFDKKFLISKAFSVIISGAFMALMVYIINQSFGFWPAFLMAPLFYVSALWLFKVVSVKDFIFVKNLLHGKA